MPHESDERDFLWSREERWLTFAIGVLLLVCWHFVVGSYSARARAVEPIGVIVVVYLGWKAVIASVTMIEKRPWPDMTISPWAREPEPPSVWQVALRYPGRAAGNALFALLFGGLLAGLVTFGIAWLAHVVLGVGELASPAPMYVVWPFTTGGLWWVGMYGDIRGWWVSGWGD